MIRARLLHGRSRATARGADEPIVLEIEPDELSRVFVAPPWLRDAGIVAWLIVGIVLVLVGLVWLLGLTSSIIVPLVTATMVAAVLAPVVGWLQAKGLPRWAATGLVLLAVVV